MHMILHVVWATKWLAMLPSKWPVLLSSKWLGDPLCCIKFSLSTHSARNCRCLLRQWTCVARVCQHVGNALLHLHLWSVLQWIRRPRGEGCFKVKIFFKDEMKLNIVGRLWTTCFGKNKLYLEENSFLLNRSPLSKVNNVQRLATSRRRAQEAVRKISAVRVH